MTAPVPSSAERPLRRDRQDRRGRRGRVVAVHSHRSRSSGFVWRPGLIVTADEALSEEGEFAVTLAGGETVPAQLVGRDPTTDVALLARRPLPTGAGSA